MKKRLISALLLGAIITSSMLAACSKPAQNDTADTTSVQTDTAPDTEADETTADPDADNLPELDYEGATVRVLYRDVHNLPDYEMTAEQTGDIIDDAIYERNLEVSERLNIKFEFTGMGDAAASAFPKSVASSVIAGENEFDFFVWGQSNSLKNALSDILCDVTDGLYFDFDRDWWNSDYMNEMRIGNDRLYFLAGDLVVTVISRMSTVFVNKDYYEELNGDIGDLYDTVLDGSFTYEKFGEMVEAAYFDTNGDGVNDINDRYGVMTTAVSNTDHFAYTAGFRLTKRDSDGYPSFDIMNERNTAIFDEIKQLYYNNPGLFITPETEIIDGTAENRFASGQMMFLPLWFAAAEKLRDMTSDYGVIPYPKYDEAEDEYRSLIQNTASVISVPCTVGDLDMVSAVLEALSAESHRRVLPAYYEVGLKTKYSRDDISSQMIDLIYSVASTDFAYAYSASLASAGTIARTVIGKNADFSSTYASLESAAVKGLEEMIDIYIS